MAKNKIALVTGGSRGLGKNMALRLAQAGHDVIITDQTQKEAADAVVAEIEGLGRKAEALQFDSLLIASLNDFISELATTLQSKWSVSTVDFLINNAAIRNNPDRKKIMASQTALGRVGEAADVGGIVAFLCSEDAHWINAQRIEASGGINL